jgi:hypothetical protein
MPVARSYLIGHVDFPAHLHGAGTHKERDDPR